MAEILGHTMRKFGQKFGAAKINMLEKIGKRDTTESPEMQNEARVEETRECLKDVYHKIDEWNKTEEASIKDARLIADALKRLSDTLAINGDHPTLANMFLRLADLETFVIDLRTKLNFLLGLRVTEPLKEFVKGDIKEARAEKKKFDRSRVAYESALDNLRALQEKKDHNPKKLQEAQEEVEKVKYEYEKSGFETINMLKDCNGKANFELLERCCDFTDVYHEYFTKGCARVSELLPRVEKYREQIAHAKLQFKETQEARKLNMDETGKAKPRVFGVPLEELCKKESLTIPQVVQKSIDFLNKTALESEGIFRISGVKSQVDKLRTQFEEGKVVDFNKVEDPNVVSGLLKMYFRELPEPLLTFDLFDQFLATYYVEDPTQRVEKLKAVIDKLPAQNRDTLRTLMQLCSNITKHVEKNKMNASNLATVLGPNLIYNKEQNPLSMKIAMDQGNGVVECMIKDFTLLFSPDTSFPKLGSRRGIWKNKKVAVPEKANSTQTEHVAIGRHTGPRNQTPPIGENQIETTNLSVSSASVQSVDYDYDSSPSSAASSLTVAAMSLSTEELMINLPPPVHEDTSSEVVSEVMQSVDQTVKTQQAQKEEAVVPLQEHQNMNVEEEATPEETYSKPQEYEVQQ